MILLGLGGVVGNFIFSLTDHAQNGFFYWTEWIPVASSAFAVGFLMTIFLTPVTRRFLVLCGLVLSGSSGGRLARLCPSYPPTFADPRPSGSRTSSSAPALAPMLLPQPRAALRCWPLGAADSPAREPDSPARCSRQPGKPVMWSRTESSRLPNPTNAAPSRWQPERVAPFWPSGVTRITAFTMRSSLKTV